MTVFTLEASAPALLLPGGFFLRLEAIDPTTGAAVTGVTASDIAVYGLAREAAALLEDEIPKLTPEELAGIFE